MTVTIDKAGRLVLPKEMRTWLHVRGGDRFQVLVQDDEIRLRPVRKEATVSRDGWLLVVDPSPESEAQDIQAFVDRDREQRAERLLGEWSSSTPRS